jgi:hypothetical protein
MADCLAPYSAPGLAEFSYATDATGAQYIALRQNEKTWKIGDPPNADSG